VPPLRDQAIVLRQWEFSETSQTVSLLTRDHGVLRGLAKGCRRDRSTFSGGFEALTRGEIGASVRPNSELATLTDWDLQEVFWSARRGLAAHLAGLYIIDLLHHALRPLDAHPGLFDRAVAALRGMELQQAIPSTVLRFQWALGDETGFQPRLTASETGDEDAPIPAKGGKAKLFSPAHGGVVGEAGLDPARREEESRRGDVWKVRPETLALLMALKRGDPPATAERAVVVRASRLLGAYWQVVLERELPTHEAYFAHLAQSGSPQPVQSPLPGPAPALPQQRGGNGSPRRL
jgi:DNA repair protein RecO (recombination protein O)